MSEPVKDPDPGYVWEQCRDCATWYQIKAIRLEGRRTKWNSLCTHCLSFEI